MFLKVETEAKAEIRLQFLVLFHKLFHNKVPITILFGYFSECNKKALDFLSVVIEKKIYVTIELQLSIDPMMLQIVKKTIRIFDYNWNRMHADTVSTSNFHGEQVSLLDC